MVPKKSALTPSLDAPKQSDEYLDSVLSQLLEGGEGEPTAGSLPDLFDRYCDAYHRADPGLQWDFLERFFETFSRYERDGLIDAELFDEARYRELRQVLDDRVSFFANTCRAYDTHPQVDSLPGAVELTPCPASPVDVSIVTCAHGDAALAQSCVESLLSQSYERSEVICVCDGSGDVVQDALVLMSVDHPRLRVLFQMRESLSTAWNHGMAAARGRYVLFLDDVDLLRNDTVERLVQIADADGADMVIVDVEAPSAEPTSSVMAGVSGGCLDLLDQMAAPFDRPGAIFARRSFLEEKGLLFPDGRGLGDLSMLFEGLAQAHVASVVHGAFVSRARPTERVFERLYGLISCVTRIQELARIQPSDRFQGAASKGLETLTFEAQRVYPFIKDKELCAAQLTAVERFVLQSLFDHAQADSTKAALAEATQREQDLAASVSFKVGRVLTRPLRVSRNLAQSLREEGIAPVLNRVSKREAPVHEAAPQALFVSSDAWRMSGAFLSLAALNHELNAHLGEHTQAVLPCPDYANIMGKQGVRSFVVESNDWIVPQSTTADSELWKTKDEQRDKNRLAALRIARYALENGFNVIHSNTSYTYVGALAAQASGLPHIWHLREFLEEDQGMKFFDKEFAHELLGEASAVVTISSALRDKYADVVGADRVRLIHNGIDKDRFYKPEHTVFESDEPVFLFVSGSESPYKGRKDLVDACALVAKKGKRFKLWFVGWSGHELLKSVRDAGLLDRTTFFGYRDDTERFYEMADVFFMCSRFEAFGRTTVEAGMCGCLVVGTASGGTSDLIKDGETGFLYPYGNPEALAAVIERVLDDPTESRAVAQRGREHFVTEFTALKNAQDVHDLHCEIVRSTTPLSEAEKRKALERISKEQAELEQKLAQATPHRAAAPVADTAAPSQETAEVDLSVLGSPSVSVIVPVYNVERYLRQCLDSIAQQTLKDIEVICVNDGSTDSSLAILEEYAANDPRFIVLSKKNSGYGASVNLGLDHAKGAYVAIIEPDDFIEPNMFEHLAQVAVKRGMVDIVKGSYWQYFDTDDGVGERVEAPLTSICHPRRTVFDVWVYPEIIYHHPSIWSCLYRRAYLVESGIRFVEAPGAGWVDNPFLIQSFCEASTITWTPEPLYNYRQTNPDASSHIKDCTMPFQRTAEMLAYLDAIGMLDLSVRGSVYKRILYNAAATLRNPYYCPEKDDQIIVPQILEIDPRFLKDHRVEHGEHEAYRHFVALCSSMHAGD